MDGESSLLDHMEKNKDSEVEKENENKEKYNNKTTLSNSNDNSNNSSSKLNSTNNSSTHNSYNNSGNLPNHLIPISTQNQHKKNNSNVSSPTSANNTQTALSSNILSRKSTFKKRHSDINVLVGTPIKEDHVHYVLMYDMLTGIRVAVSRCLAKAKRPIQEQDFQAAHKLAFDIIGNELTPSSKYDFKFKDYAPWVFRAIRDICNIDQADYLMSLTGKYVLSELGSPGKSGSFFYYSQDYRFIIKTIHHVEHKFLRKILKPYYEHIRDNPNTLICWIFGLHRVKLPHGKKIHFVVMQNILPPNKDIHERFDLKGSTQGRIVNDDQIKDKSVVLKDLNWIKLRRRIKLGPEKRKIFIEQIEKDADLLAKLNIMDYSLLIGFHNLSKGNQENIRDKTLSIFEPNPESLSQQLAKVRQGSKAVVMRKAIAESDPVALGPSTTKLPEELPKERKNCIFYQDDGGYQSTDNDNNPLNDLYFIGVIDIFTNYNYKKKIEHFFKSINNDKTVISAIHPKKYAKRFVDFIKFATYPEEELNLPMFEPYMKIREAFGIPQQTKESVNVSPVSQKEIQPVNGSTSISEYTTNKKEESKNINPIIEESKDEFKSTIYKENEEEEINTENIKENKDNVSSENNRKNSQTSKESSINDGDAEYKSQFKDFIPIYASTDLFVSPKSESPLIIDEEKENITPLPQAHIQSNLSSKRASLKINPQTVE
ncbi:SAICAR synthase-like protein [Piromyces finnis]|uniref:1-phosphatidylinositol-4-phosphate 5-kinase n=1 Tax=Piromyces finnis TaxID=1754191 RepID=A0A1Y1V2Y3_9FUNG|nr:SAICAR synthase-like protein [Piromyces finnis]|eukprot:ORX45168.1 SAICAR synthase-like protein [Piromyces finnis]